MKINTAETFSTQKLVIADSSQSPVALKIEAAHAGIVNGNYIFYTAKALREGMQSLKAFFKPLQKKHYDKTLGYIYDADFQEYKVSDYQEAIANARTNEELGKAVKAYYYSDEYQKNENGFGVLISKAKLYDHDKIVNLAQNDRGYVSIAGDSDGAVCSICYGYAAECSHQLGSRYGNEVCFAIADSLELDHISFEEIPANWKTNTLIITDSKVLGTVELIEEGQTMKLTLKDFKDSLANLDNVFTELDLVKYLDQYKEDVAAAKGGDFLFPKEKLLPLNTKLGVIVATKLQDRLEDGEDKDVVTGLISKEYVKVLGEQPLEEAVADLEVVTPTVTPEPETVPEEVPEEADLPKEGEEVPTEGNEPVENPATPLAITDADQFILRVVDSLNEIVDTKLQDLQAKVESFIEDKRTKAQNSIYADKIEALEQDLVIAGATEAKLLEDLRTSILGQIVALKQVDTESDYYKKLAERSVKELQLTLEDHLALQTGSVAVSSQPTPKEEATLAVTDAQHVKTVEQPVTAENAINQMTDNTPNDENKVLSVQDADTVVSQIVADIGNRTLGQAEYTALYKDTAKSHGIQAAKKLHVVLKQQYKI